MTDLILFEQRERIAILTLNRPEVRNILSGEGMTEAIVNAIDRLSATADIHVAVLTGAGTAFSAGGDLKRMLATATARDPNTARRNYVEGIQRIPRAFARCEVPIIAAINGPASGAGLDLACMCDIRIAAQSATFSESFVRIGIVPGDGGSWFLPRVVGLPKALEMSLTADTLDAGQALRCQLVTRVVPDAELMPTALAFAERIARHPSPAVRMTKTLLQRSLGMTLDDTLTMTSAFQALAHTTAEHKAALEQAVEALNASKRKP